MIDKDTCKTKLGFIVDNLKEITEQGNYIEKNNLVYSAGVYHCILGDYDKAEETARFGIEFTKENMDKICEMYHTTNLVWALWGKGDTKEAIERGERILEFGERFGHPWSLYIKQNILCAHQVSSLNIAKDIASELDDSNISKDLRESIEAESYPFAKELLQLLESMK